MWWTKPFWLAALVIIFPLIRLGNLSLFRRAESDFTTGMDFTKIEKDRNLTRLTILRAVTVAVTILALAGTTVLLPSKHQQMVVLLDVSASIDPAQIEESRTTALTLIHQLKPKDRVAIAAFAGEPQIISAFTTPDDAAASLEAADLNLPQHGKTDFQAALRLSKELLDQTSGNRSILLFSDGRPTAGGSIDLALNNLKGIRVDIVPVGRPGTGLYSQGLELPENVHPDEPVLAYWNVETDQAQTISATVKIDDRTVIRKSLKLLPGHTSVPLGLPGQNTGNYRVMVEAANAAGEKIPGATTGGMLLVSGPARVMVVNGATLNSPLSRSLRTQGMTVESRGIEGIPESDTGLTGYSALVLDNVPALYLTEDQQQAIQNYVAGGGGLLVVGGDSSLGRGEYYTTGLEDLLPVQTDTRQRLLFTRANILFVIDHSGSMSETVGNTSKQLAAMQGVAAAIKQLNSVDEVGILAFDTYPTWVLPFTPVSQETVIRNSLAEISQGGGTDMSTAFEEIIKGFSNRGPVRKHTVILTDGLTVADANFKELTQRLKAAGVSVTTIGVGEEINEPLLRNIAKWGEGQFYRADLDQIPKLILKETVRVTRDLIQEGNFRARIKTTAPLLSGLEQNLPLLKGYLITKPKKMATVYLETDKGDPLLASWRYGNGQVAVFTSDSGSRWLGDWSGTSYYNLLWSQIVRSIERGSPDTGLRVRTRVEAGNTRIEVEATGPDRRLRTGLQLTGTTGDPSQTFRLQETAPGHYEAEVTFDKTGLQSFLVRESQGGDWATGWAWNAPGKELQSLEPDLAFLGRIASGSGGRIFSLRQKSLPKAGWTWKRVSLQNQLVILALILLVIELGYRSTSLGQMRMARALLEAWWEAQSRLIDLMRGFTFRENSDPNESQKLNEAYRYLAEQYRRRKEAADKNA